MDCQLRTVLDNDSESQEGKRASVPALAPPYPHTAETELAVRREAAVHGVRLWGYVPGPAQWAEVARDCRAHDPGARWWIERYGKVMTIMTGATVNQYYGAERVDPTISGIGWPAPRLCLDLSYPTTPNGVARGGSSVLLHEWGHALDQIVGPYLRPHYPLHQHPDWLAAHARQDWSFASLYRNDPFEAVAEAYSLRCLWHVGRRGILPPVDLTPVVEYWDSVAARLGWLPLRHE